MYSYDHHIGYANVDLCFPCVYVCATLMVMFINVCICEHTVCVHVYVSSRVNEEYHSVHSVNIRRLTNEAVNISSSTL